MEKGNSPILPMLAPLLVPLVTFIAWYTLPSFIPEWAAGVYFSAIIIDLLLIYYVMYCRGGHDPAEKENCS